MRIVISINAASRKHTDMDTTLLASVRQVQCANDIAADGGSLVVFAPIDIGAACAACTVHDVSRFDSVELDDDAFSVFHADGGGINGFALVFEEGCEVAGDPAVTAPNQECVLSRWRNHDM